MNERPYPYPFVVVPPGPGRLLWEVHNQDGLADMGITTLPAQPGRMIRIPFAEPIQGPLMLNAVVQFDEDEDEG
jgi:hypothetical protein